MQFRSQLHDIDFGNKSRYYITPMIQEMLLVLPSIALSLLIQDIIYLHSNFQPNRFSNCGVKNFKKPKKQFTKNYEYMFNSNIAYNHLLLIKLMCGHQINTN